MTFNTFIDLCVFQWKYGMNYLDDLAVLQKYVSVEDIFIAADEKGSILDQNATSFNVFGSIKSLQVFLSKTFKNYKNLESFINSSIVYDDTLNQKKYDLFFRKYTNQLYIIQGYLSPQKSNETDKKVIDDTVNDIVNSFFTNSEFALVVFNEELRISKINEKACMIFEKEEHSLLGQTIYNLTQGERKEERIARYLNVLETGKPIEFEDIVQFNNGHKKHLHISASNINNNLFLLTLDISKVRLLEEDLFQKEQLLEEVQKISDMGFWKWDLKTNIITWSANTFKIFEISPTDFDGSVESYNKFIHHLDVQKVANTIQKCLENKESYQIEHRIITSKGKIKYVLGSGMPVTDKNGQILFLMGAVQDLTFLKKSQESLLVANNLNYKILSSINEAVVMISKKHNVVDCNANFENIFAVSKKIIANKSEKHLFNEISKAIMNPDEFLEMISGVFQMPEIEVFDIIYLKNGQIIEYHHKVIIEDGKIVNRLWIFNDITEWKKINDKLLWYSTDLEIMTKDLENKQTQLENTIEELGIAKQKAEDATKAKSKFLASMSHEIRTPMNAIMGFSEILTNRVVDPDNKKYLKNIVTATQKLLELINDILDLSKIEAGKIDFAPDFININSLLEEVVQLFAYKAETKGISLNLHIDEGIADFLYLDDIRVRQILLNLVGNALKFTEKGKIDIQLILANSTEEYQDICIKVIDTGIGIKKHSIDEIFEEFTQQEGQDARKYGGTGLGLAISKRLIEMMNGKISVKSKINVGSEFIIDLLQLPFKLASNANKVSTKEQRNYKFNNLKLLILDDVIEDNIIETYYKEMRCDVSFTDDADQAIKLVSSFDPDLIIVDIKVPDLTANNFIHQVRVELQSTSKIIITTAATSEEIDFSILSLIDGQIRKPIDFANMNDMIYELLPDKVEISNVNSSKVVAKNYLEIDLTEEERNHIIEKTKNMIKYFIISDIEALIDDLIIIAKNKESKILSKFIDDMQHSLSRFDIDDINKKLNYLYSSVTKNK